MRAVVFDGPAADTGRTRVVHLDEPEPGPGELTVDVAFAGVNFKDVMARRGDAAYVTAWPYAPGIEVAGTVRSVGQGVTGFGLGQRVVAYVDDGGLAEVAVVRAALTVAVPEGQGLEVAAAAPGALTTAVLLLDQVGRFRAGDHLLVHSAAGAVGYAVARLARLGGAGSLFGAVGSHTRVAAAEQAGYDKAFVRGPDLATALLGHAGGPRFDLILDPQGTTQLDVDLQLVAPTGRIVLFGNAPGEPLGQLPPAGRLYAGNISVAGFSLAALASTAPDVLAAALARAIRHLAAGELEPQITVVDGLDATADAQQSLAEGRARGKLVVQV